MYGHSKHPLPTMQEKTLHVDITRYVYVCVCVCVCIYIYIYMLYTICHISLTVLTEIHFLLTQQLLIFIKTNSHLKYLTSFTY